MVSRWIFIALFWISFQSDGAWAAPNREWRCLWVESWGPGILSRDQCDRLLATARRYRFNTLFVEVRRCADAYYNSSLEPRAPNIEETDFDPLGYLLEKAREEPAISIHAWVAVYRAWLSKEKRVPLNRRHVVNRHSEWLIVNRKGDREAPEGYYLDPALPEVQEYLVEVLRKLIERYDVDGLHLDYIRYPGADWGYGTRSLALWRKASGRTDTPSPGDPQWSAWRRDQVTALVRRVYGEIVTRRPSVLLSAATITWGGLEMGYENSSPMTETFQDWLRWKEEGIVDIVCPMNYKRGYVPKQAGDFIDWSRFVSRAPGRGFSVIGIAGWLNDIPTIVSQIGEARRAGADGVAIFSYQRPARSRAEKETLLAAISSKVFRTRVRPPERPRRDPEGTVFGQVRAGWRGVAGCLVRLSPAVASWKVQQATTDQNGYFLFARVTPQRYRLDALGKDGRLLARAAVSVQPGRGLRRDLQIPDLSR